MLLNEIVFLRGWEIMVDLIVFDILDFDIIFAMDFLSQYRAKIDYKKKKILF